MDGDGLVLSLSLGREYLEAGAPTSNLADVGAALKAFKQAARASDAPVQASLPERNSRRD
jgi:hypothetical protein